MMTWFLWLMPVALYWILLALIARVPTGEAIKVTNVLFALALPITFGALLAAVRSVCKSAGPVLRLLAVTLGITIAIGLFELAAVARLVNWEVVFMSLRGENQHYVPDPELGFRHAPHTQWFGRLRSDVEAAWGLPTSASDPITITYDTNGYRNTTPIPRADIVLIGDSYIEGAYVSDDQTLSRVLQERLGATVANLGVAGYGTAQELIVLKRDGMRLKPRIVIWFFFEGNDLYNDHAFQNFLLAPPQGGASGLTSAHGWWRRSFIRNTYAQLRLLSHPLVPRQCPHFGILRIEGHRGKTVLFGPDASPPWTEFEWRQWQTARETLNKAARFTREHNSNFLLVYVPTKFRVYRDFIDLPARSELREWTLWPLPDLFGQFCRAEQLACLDLTESLRNAVSKGQMPYAQTDSHWSPEGHRLIAQRLQEMLESFGWISARDLAARGK